MFTLSKAFRFEAAHRIAKGYVGKCANIHGHSWQGEIHLACETMDPMGMGIDFQDIQTFIDIIVARFDHKLILYKDDSALIRLCREQNWEIVLFDDENPTSERIAKYIAEEATSYFKLNHPDSRVLQVIVEETCTSRCTWQML